ncbi:MAG: glycosyltransferase family 2 protein [Bacteroidota bacterium]
MLPFRLGQPARTAQSATALGVLVVVLSATALADPSGSGSVAEAWAGPWEVTQAADVPAVRAESGWVRALIYTLYGVIFLILLYTLRHYAFTFNRMFGRQRHPYAALDTLAWPAVTVLIPAHNEEAVIADSIGNLLKVDYPADRITVIPVNDRSQDRTRAVIDACVAEHPGRIRPFHRTGGKPGKAAALNDAYGLVDTDIVLIFDADYLPGRDLIKTLVAPFFDPEIGAVMGRVVPVNTDANLMTRLLDLERTGGYQVDQQARMNLGLVPQYGGTCGGVRRSVVDAVGGWRDDTLTEDTDITCKVLAAGWKVAYVNRAECYEESPETWSVRTKQIRRWARGHTDAAIRYAGTVLGSAHLGLRGRLDGLLLLGVYAMGPVLLLGWLLAVTLFYLGLHPLNGVIALLAVASYNTLGNFAAFFEIASGARLDGGRQRIRLLPLNLLGFLVSLVATSRAVIEETVDQIRPGKRRLVWDKTKRFRSDTPDLPGSG